MVKFKTRMPANQRRAIVLAHTGNIKPAMSAESAGYGIDELRRKGSLAASRITACVARRASFKVGTGNIIRG